MSDEFGMRLQKARREAGFKTADEALTRFSSWKEHTYKSHEAGRRVAKDDALKDYARAYKVRVEWLRYGIEPMRDIKYTQESPSPSHGFGDSGYTGKRRKVSEMLDTWETLTAVEQDEFLAVAMIHKKDHEGGAGKRYLPLSDDTLPYADKSAQGGLSPGGTPGKKTTKG